MATAAPRRRPRPVRSTSPGGPSRPAASGYQRRSPSLCSSFEDARGSVCPLSRCFVDGSKRRVDHGTDSPFSVVSWGRGRSRASIRQNFEGDVRDSRFPESGRTSRGASFQSRTCLPETRRVGGVLLGASQSRKKGFARSSFSFLASSAADRESESHEFHETNFAERKKVRHHHHHHHHHHHRFLQVRPSAFLAPWRTPSRGSANCRGVSRQPTRWSERRSRTERHEERRPMLPEGVRVLANDVHHDKQCCSTQPLTRATKNHEITQDDVS